jgi:hypothetical protein
MVLQGQLATRGEVILPFRVPRAQVPDAKLFRSTWLSSSLLALRERGEFDRYLSLLDPEYHHAVVTSFAGTWLPIEVAVAHYRACGGLGLTKEQIAERSLEVTRRVHKTVLELALRVARDAGASPWTIYNRLDRLWDRVWQGGGVSVTRIGPKDALIEIVGWRCAAEPYCRTAMPSVVTAVTELFCQRAFVNDATKAGTPGNSLALRASWA